jgi:hypothetical protein
MEWARFLASITGTVDQELLFTQRALSAPDARTLIGKGKNVRSGILGWRAKHPRAESVNSIRRFPRGA